MAIDGDEFDNVLPGTPDDDVINGNGGNDALYGGAGADELNGGSGFDWLTGGAGNDAINGGDDEDTAVYDDASGGVTVDLSDPGQQNVGGDLGEDTLNSIERLVGSIYADTLTGDGNLNYLFGNDGADHLYGGGGEDHLHAGEGNDFLYGQDGDDILSGEGGNDTLDGGDGVWDNAWFREDTLGIFVDLFAHTASGDGIGTDTLTNLETINAGSGDDGLYGDGNANGIWGNEGADTLAGRGGDDLLDGGDGNDTASYEDDTAGVKASLATGAATGTNSGADTLYNIENVTGGSGNDTINGDGGDNVLDGGAGDDTLKGGLGNDTLIGGADDDTALFSGLVDDYIITYDLGDVPITVVGPDGTDTLIGIEFLVFGALTGEIIDGTEGDDDWSSPLSGTGEPDVINGLGGNDVLIGWLNGDPLEGDAGDDDVLNGGAGHDALYGGDGNDELNGGSGFDWLTGGAGNDAINGGDDEDTAVYDDASGGVTVDLSDPGPQIVGGGLGQDTLNSIENLVGSIYADMLTGKEGFNSLYGGNGNDTLLGAGGDDWLEGGADNDSINGGDGNDLAIFYHGVVAGENNIGVSVDLSIEDEQNVGGGLGADTFVFVDGLNTVEGLNGSIFNDSLTGNDSNNFFYGEEGNDTIIGAGGDDWLDGSPGDDTLDGGSGIDEASYGYNATPGPDNEGVTVNLNLSIPQNVGGGLGTDTFVFEGELNTIENLSGSPFDDTLTGDGTNNNIRGGGGDDEIAGGGGDDTIEGQDDNDHLQGNGDNDTVYGGFGNDSLSGGPGDDSLDGEEGIDTASYDDDTAGVKASLATGAATGTNSGADTLYNIENVTGGSGNDTITGDGGDNVLDGGVGDDTLKGGAGNDTLIGGADIDTAVFSGIEADYTITYDLDVPITVAAKDGSGTDTLSGIEFLAFGAPTGEIINGTEFNDISLNGSELDDVINGLGGNDGLFGHGGDDELNGGAGNDNLDGGDGDDVMTGGTGDDTYALDSAADQVIENANEGTDTVRVVFNIFTIGDIANVENVSFIGTGNFVGTGDDLNNQISGGSGNDTLSGGIGNDTLSGNSGVDTLQGGDGNDILNGGQGDDWIYGGDGNDNFSGAASASAGKDHLEGGAGNDTMAGGTGDDYLDGGADIDTLSFNNTGISGVIVSLNISTAQNVGSGQGLDTFLNFENLIGSSGNDTLTGNDKDNVLRGLLGNDILDGGDGVDTVSYTFTAAGVTVDLAIDGVAQFVSVDQGWDTIINIESLIGSTGNDTLYGDENTNKLGGSGGNDTLYGRNGADTLVGSTGDDTLFGDAGNDNLNGGIGNDILDGGDDIDTANYSFAFSGVTVDLGNPDFQDVHGDELNPLNPSVDLGLDKLIGIENLLGSAFGDTLTGDANANVLDGSGGNDIITGGGGADTLTGGAGNDTFRFELLGDLTDDVITDFDGDHTDKLDFSVIALSLGGLTFIVSEGFSGGLDGAELRYETDEAAGTTVVQIDSDGNGIADYQVTLVGVGDLGDIAPGLEVVLTSVDGPSGRLFDGYIAGAFVFADENLNGIFDSDEASAITDGNGQYTLSPGASGPLIATGGIDVSTGLPFTGQLSAPAGSSVITPLTTLINELIVPGVVNAEAAEELLKAALGLSPDLDLTRFDPIAAITGADPAVAEQAASVMAKATEVVNTIAMIGALLEGAGADAAEAQSAALAALSESIADADPAVPYEMSSADTIANVIADAGDIADVDTSAVADAAAQVIADSNALAEDTLLTGEALLTYLAQNSIVAQGDAADALEEAGETGEVSTLLDEFTGDALEAAVVAAADEVGDVDGAILGTSVNDTLVGTPQNDVIDGLAGNDSLTGNDGNDRLLGGGGNDGLNGGNGNDHLDGGSGGDAMTGGAGDDTYVVDNAGDSVVEKSRGGSDTVETSLGSYTLGSQVENLTYVGSNPFSGTGNNLDNVMTGGDNGNSLSGKDGMDTLLGGLGDDSLDGGNNNDIIVGGRGADIVRGGGGADRFVFGPGDLGGSSADQVADFNSGQKDLLDFSAFDGTFSFMGSSAFDPDLPGNQLRYLTVGNNAELQGYINGSVDFTILLIGVKSLTATDFIL